MEFFICPLTAPPFIFCVFFVWPKNGIQTPLPLDRLLVPSAFSSIMPKNSRIKSHRQSSTLKNSEKTKFPMGSAIIHVLVFKAETTCNREVVGSIPAIARQDCKQSFLLLNRNKTKDWGTTQKIKKRKLQNVLLKDNNFIEVRW